MKIRLPRGVFSKKQFQALTEDKIRKLYREVDADGSGGVNLGEFAVFLNKRFGINPPQRVLETLLKQIDTDYDGQISEEEFVAFFMEVLLFFSF